MKAKTIRFRSHRDHAPRLGHYFKSPRGRFAYHIVRVVQGRTGLGGDTVFKCTVEKIVAARLPEGADVIAIYWDSRGKKRR
jgi:hypothetical protein